MMPSNCRGAFGKEPRKSYIWFFCGILKFYFIFLEVKTTSLINIISKYEIFASRCRNYNYIFSKCK